MTYKKQQMNIIHLFNGLSQSVLHVKNSLLKVPQSFFRRENDKEPQAVETIQAESDKFRKGMSNKVVNHRLIIASSSLGVSLAVRMLYPPLALLSIMTHIYAGLPYYKRTYKLLRHKKVNIDSMITILSFGCIVFGYLVLANAALVLAFLSRTLVQKVKKESNEQLFDIFKEIPNVVWVRVDDTELSIPFNELKLHDQVIVSAGETIPVDGTIIDGMASVDQHILTGEARPVEKGVGDEVFASSVILRGKLIIDVQHAGTETTVAKIADILNETVEFKTLTELRAQRLAERTVVPTLVLSGLSLPFIGPSGALAIIAAHFRHKVTAIMPISILNFFNVASRYGILFKDGRSLDLLHQVDTIVFDKTGTLTEEEPSIGHIYAYANYDERQILQYASAAESRQRHPIARAIVRTAKDRGIKVPPLDEANYSVGYGLTVLIENKVIEIGSHRFMQMRDIIIPPEVQTIQETCHQKGHSLVMMAADHQLIGAIEIIPTIRPEVKNVIDALRQDRQIKQIYMISGDHDAPARMLAQELGLDHYIAEASPEEKASHIRRLCEEGKYICYIGDGINDAIAMKQSHVSVSLRGASTMAMDTAHIVLMNQGLASLPIMFDLAHRFQTNTNITFAFQVIPSIVSIGGVFVAGIGLGSAFVLGWVGLLAGLVNATAPVLAYTPSPSVLIDGISQQIDTRTSAEKIESNNID